MLDQEPGEHASEIKYRKHSQSYSTIVIEDSSSGYYKCNSNKKKEAASKNHIDRKCFVI